MEDRSADELARVRAARRGDKGAFGTLVSRYQSMVAGVAWRYGVGRDDIEDVVHDVFLKVHRNLDKYRPDYPFSTWLYRLAVNHVLDRGRRAKKERGRVEMPLQVADRRPGVGETLERDERARLLREALDEIDERYREVIFLVYVEDQKVDQVASTLDLPSGTVKTRLMRGRRALKKILERRHPEHFGARA